MLPYSNGCSKGLVIPTESGFIAVFITYVGRELLGNATMFRQGVKERVVCYCSGAGCRPLAAVSCDTNGEAALS